MAMVRNNKKGKLIIISAPSGSGKTTLVKHILSSINNISFSVSACSRKPRQNEIDGKDYFFLTLSDFKTKIENDEFIEWEEVYKDHFYGTLNSEVEKMKKAGRHVAFDVDVAGGVSIKSKFGNEALAIFIKPPSIDALKQRLVGRATDNSEDITNRIEKADLELTYEDKFDVTIINDNLTEAKKEIVDLISKFINN